LYQTRKRVDPLEIFFSHHLTTIRDHPIPNLASQTAIQLSRGRV